MDALQRTIQSIMQQVRGLSRSTQLLIGSFAVILAMTLFLVALYAGRQTMAPLPVALTADNRNKALEYLDTVSIPYKLQGDKVLVPVDRRFSVLAQLTDHELIGSEHLNFQVIMDEQSPFASREKNRQRYLIVKMSVLERTISRMQGIVRATVVISEPDRRTPLGQPDLQPSASVTVQTLGDPLTQSKVDAIARLVAGAHAGLRPSHVHVIDARSGLAMTARTDDDLAASKYLDTKLAAEKHVRREIQNLLGYIPGVRISVNAQVDTSQTERRSDVYEEPRVGPLEESSRSVASTSRTTASEPGVRSNTGVDISSAAGPTSELVDERNDSRLYPVFPRTSQHELDAGGHPLKINATISIPRSYLVGIYQQRQDDPQATPDDAALQQISDEVTGTIRADVAPLIETDAIEDAMPGTVQVSVYHDFTLTGLPEGTATGALASTSSSVSDGSMLDGGMVKHITLGGLAVLSLGMMLMMVRKATVKQNLPTAEELVGLPPALAGDAVDLVGEAEESYTPMEGLEIGEEDLEQQQKLKQINELAMNSPQEAAALIRKWMRATE